MTCENAVEAHHRTITTHRAPCTHIRSTGGTEQGAKSGTEGRIGKTQTIIQRAKHTDSDIVGGDVCTEPQQGHLHIVGSSGGMTEVGRDSTAAGQQ